MAVRVLVTDGSPAARESIRRLLECIGCEIVAEAATAAQALPLFRTVRPEIVTLGVGLTYGGHSNPLNLLRLITRESPTTSIVMVGVTEVMPDGLMFLREGALACMVEPLNIQVLWGKLSPACPELNVGIFAEMISHTNARKASRL